MKSLVEALITAVDYINDRTEEMDEQDDLKALESVAAYLDEMSDDEFEALKSECEALGRGDWLEDMLPGRLED
jgi:hypothetical protein